MIPGAFEYHRPGSVEEAVALLAKHSEDGKLLAGGHSLVPMMKLRLAEPAHLIDINRIEALKGISEDGGTIRIGAATTQAELLGSALLARSCPLLGEAAALIADPQVRSCGTVGGNVANGDPGNDMPAVMMALGATYLLHGPNGAREVDARGFYEAPYFTARGDDEVLTAVRIPVPPAGTGASYTKMKRKVGDYATAAAAVLLTMDGGKCAAAAVALSNVAPTPVHVAAASAALAGTSIDEAAISAAAEAAVAASDPVTDMRGPAEFRAEMAGVMTRRAIETALGRAQGG